MRHEGLRRAQDLRKVKRKEVRIRCALSISMHMSFLRQLEKFLYELYEKKQIGSLLILKERLDALTECRETKELNTMLKTFSKQYNTKGVIE